MPSLNEGSEASLKSFAALSLSCWVAGALFATIAQQWLGRLSSLYLYTTICFVLPPLLMGWGKILWGQISLREWRRLTTERVLGGRVPLYLAIFGLCALVLPLSALLGTISQSGLELLPSSWGIASSDHVEESAIEILKRTGLLARIGQLFTFAILPAFAEELYFRGSLQPLLQRYLGRERGIWMASIIFSLIHLSAVGFLPRLAVGLALGYSYDRTHSLPMAIGLHMLNNAVALTLLIADTL